MAADPPAPRRSAFRNRTVLVALSVALVVAAGVVAVVTHGGRHSKQAATVSSAAADPDASPSPSLSRPATTPSTTVGPTVSATASLSASRTPLTNPRRTPTPTPTSTAPALLRPSVSAGTTPPTKPATSGCLPHPSACGYPDASNTGVPAGTALVRSTGVYTIRKSGSVVSGLDVTGRVQVDANNVTIKDSLITADQFYGVSTGSGYDGTVITDVTIIGSTDGGGQCDVGIYGGVFHATRVNVSNCSDGFHLTGSGSVVDSYFHDPYFTGSSHNDGVQVFDGTGLVIRHNTIDMGGPRGNSCVFLQPTNGRIQGATIDSNLLNGGGFTLYIEQSTGVVLSNNRIGRTYNFAWFSRAHNTHVPVITHNIWDDTGTPVV
jgi:hypothetical protein